jgi:hypothetical protein
VPAAGLLTLDFRASPGDGRWLPETAVDPVEILMGAAVRHRSFGRGTLLSVGAGGRSTQLLIRFDGVGDKWIAFGYGLLEFDSAKGENR